MGLITYTACVSNIVTAGQTHQYGKMKLVGAVGFGFEKSRKGAAGHFTNFAKIFSNLLNFRPCQREDYSVDSATYWFGNVL
jgi:hypothetical protein